MGWPEILDPKSQAPAVRNRDPNILMTDGEAKGVEYPTYTLASRKE